MEIKKTSDEQREEIIAAARIAVDELIKVAREPILKAIIKPRKDKEGDLTEEEAVSLGSDKQRVAAQAKKLSIFEAFDILARIDTEQSALDSARGRVGVDVTNRQGFAERNSNKPS